jgi:putative oxidoreductase
MSSEDEAKYTSVDIGLLLLRVGLGAMFIYHGIPKFLGGPESWVSVGGAMKTFGITFAPGFWGFMAAFSELFGGIFLILGLFFRPVCVLLTITMLVAANMTFKMGQGLMGAAHPLELAIVFISLIFIGTGSIRSTVMPSEAREE